MKLVTFNIRCDFGQDGENNFEYRKDLILKKIAQEKPDMICFQEVLPHIAKWLKENLTEYYVIGCGRSPEPTGCLRRLMCLHPATQSRAFARESATKRCLRIWKPARYSVL